MTVDQVLAMARELTPVDKLGLVEKLIPEIEAAVEAAPTPERRPWYVALSDLGPAPSGEDIQEVRRDMRRDVPRSDVARGLRSPRPVGVSASTLDEVLYLAEKGHRAGSTFDRLLDVLRAAGAGFREIPVDHRIVESMRLIARE